ncbi:MAG: ABC transporter ATP-binding protein [Bdellovibrionota bacterium]
MNEEILTANSINKSYAQGNERLQILKNLDLNVSIGKTIAIVGQSGSGKSTLLSLLAGLDQPDSGSIQLNGMEITTLDEANLTRHRSKSMGIVFQQFHLMPHLTAIENIRLPLDILRRDNSLKKAKKALEEVKLGARKDHYPHQLSGGECQRVAIARALVIRPPILLADEPSGNLDEETGNKVMDLLFDLTAQNQMAMILVTHNNTLANRCDQILHLENGTLIL